MTKRIGRLSLPTTSLPLPMIVSHREWCQFLAIRGSLAPHHRGCLRADRCVAIKGKAVHEPDSWDRHRVAAP